MSKTNGYGKAKVYSDADKTRLLSKGLQNHSHRTLFLMLYYTGCRVTEAVQLKTEDVYEILHEWYEHDELCTKRSKTRIRDVITFRRESTKGKTKTRSVPVHDELRSYLERHIPGHEWVFPGRTVIAEDGTRHTEHLTERGADQAIRRACARVALKGYSTHSGRRTLITRLHASGVGLKTIQEITGHADLRTMQEYVDVSDRQKAAAINML